MRVTVQSKTFKYVLFVVVILVAVGAIVFVMRSQDDSDENGVQNSTVKEFYTSQLPELKERSENEPNNATLQKEYAVGLYVTGDKIKAAEQYEKAISLTAQDASLWNGAANTYRDIKNFEKAAQYYEKAIELEPKSAVAYTNYGHMLHRNQQKPELAIPIYLKGTQAIPNNSDLKLYLAEAYVSAKQPELAKQEFKSILAKDPNDSAALKGLEKLEQSEK